jgi:hypothetical protein
MPDKKGIKHMKPKPQTITMIVRLIDGSVHRFRFTPADDDDVQLAGRIEKAFQAQDLVLEISGRLLVIPQHSILSIELTPAPAKLPAVAIRNAQVIE